MNPPVPFVLERFVCHTMRGNLSDAQDVLVQERDVQRRMQQILWPTVECVAALEGDGLISPAVRQRADDMLRGLADETIRQIAPRAPYGRTVLLQLPPRGELAGHITSAVLKCRGWNVFLAGGDFSLAELIAWAGMLRPHAIMIAAPQHGLDHTTRLLAGLRKSGLWPQCQIALLCSAPDISPQCWADLVAGDPLELARLMQAHPTRRTTAAPRALGSVPAGMLEFSRVSWRTQYGLHAN